MSNETSTRFSRAEQEDLLVGFYADILNGKDEPSPGYQKRFLLQLLNTKIAQVESKTDRMRHIHYALRISVMVFSGVTTILLGLKLAENELLSQNISNAALVLSATITFMSGLAVFWDTENYWIRNKIMLNKLKELRYEYVFHLTGPPADDSRNLRPFLDKFLSSLGDEYWEKFLKDVRRPQGGDVPPKGVEGG